MSELSFNVIQDKRIEKLVLSLGIFIGDDDDSDDSVELQHKRRRTATGTQHSFARAARRVSSTPACLLKLIH